MRKLLACLWISLACHVGGAAGLALTYTLLMRPAAARHEAERPGQPPCGMFHAPFTALGLAAGVPAGGLAGWWAWRRFTRGAHAPAP